MSRLTPADDVPRGSHILESVSDVRPSAELLQPSNAPRLWLFEILREAWKNLRAELCPSQPKSIWTKAGDLERNLPHWDRKAGDQPMAPNTAIDLSKELKAYADVLKAAGATIARLGVLVRARVLDDKIARDEWKTLLMAVHSALKDIGGEFTDTTTQNAGNQAK